MKSKATGRILVVDDTPANLSLLLDALTDVGYEVLVAESGRSALSLLDHTTPELILLDLVMPGMDGIATCKHIKARPGCASLPVLFMTAVEEPAQKLRAFETGARDYITKPVYPPEVLARVASHLEISRLHAALADELAMRIEAENELSQSLDRAVVLLDREQHVVFSTRRAKILLHQHFSGFTGNSMPSLLDAPDSPLVVHRFTESGSRELELIMLEEKRATPGPAALMSLGLTARESEVLYWVAQGKSNPDVAVILGAAVRTVQKHVENIFRKLGLETRHAATLAALEILHGRRNAGGER